MNISTFFAIFLCFFSNFANATEVMDINLSMGWMLPFVGVLGSIAIFPVVASNFWHHHFGKITLFWILLFLGPFTFFYGTSAAFDLLGHTVIAEYVPFIVLPVALYVVGGGIYFKGSFQASAASNTLLLTIGGLLASIMGTMGASMVLVRPFLKANKNRYSVVHIVIFFILVVSNVGGILTPLGDPPLFLGYLNGISFFWTTCYLAMPMTVIFSYLLIVFYFLDLYLFKKDKKEAILRLYETTCTKSKSSLFDGKINFLLLALIIATIFLSGFYQESAVIEILNVKLALSNVLRDVALFAIILGSSFLTPKNVRISNNFTWEPVVEIVKLFLGIFITMSPVMLMLKQGTNGVFAPLIDFLKDMHGEPVSSRYFWITGMLSSLLDNSPTYLIFFNIAGGDAQWLMGAGSRLLVAISSGAVFFGSLTYIGNAPNFIVKAIAESYHVKMPSFFSYMLLASLIMVPIFVVVSLIFL